MCNGRGTPGNRTTDRGKIGSSLTARTLSLASLIGNVSARRSIGPLVSTQDLEVDYREAFIIADRSREVSRRGQQNLPQMNTIERINQIAVLIRVIRVNLWLNNPVCICVGTDRPYVRSRERGAMRRMVESSCSISKGLSRNSSAPTA